MARNTWALALAAFLSVALGAPAAEIARRERVAVPGPASPATVEGRLRGYETVEYQVGGTVGDTMSLSLSADNPQAFFNLYAPGDVPGESTALFIGARDGREYRGALPEAGDYTVHVVLMRPAARRAETAEYRLTVELSGVDSTSAAGEATEVPAESEQAGARPATAQVSSFLTGPSGQLPCAAVADVPAAPCAFRASRRGGGTALVVVTLANGDERAILFVGGHPVASDRLGAPFSAVRQGQQMHVSVDEERYEVPAFVVRGR